MEKHLRAAGRRASVRWGSFLDCAIRAWPLKTGGGQWRQESWNWVYVCGLCCGCVNSGDQKGNVSSALRAVEVAAMAAWELICVEANLRMRARKDKADVYL